MYNTSDTVLMETKLCEDIRTIRLRRNGTSPLGFAIRGGKFRIFLFNFFNCFRSFLNER